MIDWLGLTPAVLISIALIFGPGLALGMALGLRRLWLWALAPALSATMLSIAALVLPFVGIRWSLITALGFSLIFGALVFLLYHFALRVRLDDRSAQVSRWPAALGLVIGGAILLCYFTSAVVHPENFSQTFDNVFHLNAIAFISDTGSASSLTIGALTMPEGGQGFYPLTWHGLVQLVQQAAGVSSAAAINAVNLSITTCVWPAGIMLLARQFAGPSRVATLSSGILAAAFPAFPLNMLSYGVLYPYFSGLALVPVTFAVTLQLLQLTKDGLISSKLGLGILLLGLIPGVALSHPVALMSVLALSVPAVLIGCFGGWSTIPQKAKAWRLIALALYSAVGLVMLLKLRPGVMWGARTDTFNAFWRILTVSLEDYGLSLLIGALVLAGVYFTIRRRDRIGFVAISVWLVFSVLYFLAAGFNDGFVRGLTGVWYGDAPRLAALMPIVMIPLVVIAITQLFNYTKQMRGAPAIAASGLVVLLIVTQLSAGYGSLLAKMREMYTIDANSLLITTDERALLDRVSGIVPADEMIAGSPWTGTSLAYAFAGRHVVMPHILVTPGNDRELIMNSLDEANRLPAVCKVVNRLNVRWYLDFGDREVHKKTHIYPGFDELVKNKIVELVDQEGDARLYRIVACDAA